MSSIGWNLIETVELRNEMVHWPWRVAVPIVRDVTHLMMIASGSWTAEGAQLLPFPPDGHMGLPIQADRLLIQECASGALIGKLGGSSATLSVAGGSVPVPSLIFPIGAHCLVPIPAGIRGPLFIGFNWIQRPLRIIDLKVEVHGAAPP
jgi:hypothetical protein